jgi:hypothetical protein
MDRIRELEDRLGDAPGPDKTFDVMLNADGQERLVMDELLRNVADESGEKTDHVPQILRDLRL